MTEGNYRLDLEKIPITSSTLSQLDGSNVLFPREVFMNNNSKNFMFLYPCYRGVIY